MRTESIYLIEDKDATIIFFGKLADEKRLTHILQTCVEAEYRTEVKRRIANLILGGFSSTFRRYDDLDLAAVECLNRLSHNWQISRNLRDNRLII